MAVALLCPPLYSMECCSGIKVRISPGGNPSRDGLGTARVRISFHHQSPLVLRSKQQNHTFSQISYQYSSLPPGRGESYKGVPLLSTRPIDFCRRFENKASTDANMQEYDSGSESEYTNYWKDWVSTPGLFYYVVLCYHMATQ